MVWAALMVVDAGAVEPLRLIPKSGVTLSAAAKSSSVDEFLQQQQSAKRSAVGDFTRAMASTSSAEQIAAVQVLRKTISRLDEKQQADISIARRDDSAELLRVRSGFVSNRSRRTLSRRDRLLAELAEVSGPAGEADNQKQSTRRIEWFRQDLDRLRQVQRRVAKESEDASNIAERAVPASNQLREYVFPTDLDPSTKSAIEQRRQTVQGLMAI